MITGEGQLWAVGIRASLAECSVQIGAVDSIIDTAERRTAIKAIEARKDRNVAVYGMITVRAMGDKVVIAQKLEKPRKDSQKLDWYELRYDAGAGAGR